MMFCSAATWRTMGVTSDGRSPVGRGWVSVGAWMVSRVPGEWMRAERALFPQRNKLCSHERCYKIQARGRGSRSGAGAWELARPRRLASLIRPEGFRFAQSRTTASPVTVR